MLITSGKHCGKSVEQLVLRYPDAIDWIFVRHHRTAQRERITHELTRLIKIFDSKPLVNRCNREGCTNAATLYTVYLKSTQLQCWCGRCNPCAAGRVAGNLSEHLHEVHSYSDAVSYVHSWCNGNVKSMQILIQAMAETKGISTPITKARAAAFFNLSSSFDSSGIGGRDAIERPLHVAS